MDAESNGEAEVELLEVPPNDEPPAADGPVIRGMATIKVLSDGSFNVELVGVTQLEAPSLLRVAAKRVEHELGIG